MKNDAWNSQKKHQTFVYPRNIIEYLRISKVEVLKVQSKFHVYNMKFRVLSSTIGNMVPRFQIENDDIENSKFWHLNIKLNTYMKF